MDITLQDPAERPRKTALERLQEQIERQVATFRQLHDVQDLLRRHSPEYQMRELLRQFESSRRFRELLEQSSISTQVQEMLNSASIAAQTQKLMEQYFPRSSLGLSDEAWRRVIGADFISEAAKHYDQYLKPISQQHEMLERLQRQAFGGLLFEGLAEQIVRASPAIAAIEAARKSLDRLWGQFRDVDFSQFEAGVEDEQDAELAARTIAQEASEQQSFQEAVERIVAAIQAQQKPTVQLMLWLFFRKVMDWLIAGAIGAAMGHYAPVLLGESRQAAKKEVQETARVAVGSSELLVEYRYVSAKVLIVRQNPKARSPEVARLAFGKAVKLVKKDKDFALVLWTDKESGVEVQGWVFARYLGKFS